jgi:hypothetical protein
MTMKSLISTLGLGLALATGAFAQGKPSVSPAPSDSARKAAFDARFAEVMSRLPEGVAEKIAAARNAAKAAKDDVDAMKAQGKTPEEVKAMIAEKKAAALLNLQKALDALNSLPDGAMERVAKAREGISTRLEERKSEATTP